MNIRILFIGAFLLLLQGCGTTERYSTDAYRQIKNEIEKDYQLSRVDLVLNYDLVKVNNGNYIYSEDLGLFTNEKAYIKPYLHTFKLRYKSSGQLVAESKKKITRISNLLIGLHGKYKILSSRNYHYITKLTKEDLNNANIRQELARLDHILSRLPLMLPLYKAHVSSYYGNRRHPVNGKYLNHCGIDLVARTKSPVYSSADGQVSFVGIKNGYGTVVEINHGNNIKTKYAHLKKALVSKGQKVVRGQVIGVQGASGNATREHLHFEVHLARRHLNPYDFIGHNYGRKDI